MKNILVYIWRLAVVIAVSTGGGAELQRGAADMVTRISPRMTCESPNVVSVNANSISVFTAGEEIVYRRQAVLSLTFPLGEIIELQASSIGACAKLAAEAGLAAFEFLSQNSRCLAYSNSNHFLTCFILCLRVIYVTSHIFPEKPRLVTFEEAPWKPGPYNNTREYMLEKLIYLDESNTPQPYFPGQAYDPRGYENGLSYATLQNKSTFCFSQLDVDLSTCLYYDGDAGIPTLVSSIFFNDVLTLYYFTEICGDTIKLRPRNTYPNLGEVFTILVYSHRGYGCSEFPGKTSVNCTVNIEYDTFSINSFSEGLNGPNGNCDGLTLTANAEGAERDICGRYESVEQTESGPVAFTLQGSAPDARLGFYFSFSYA